MPAGKWSFSLFRANFDRRQGLTDVNEFGVTGAVAFGRAELFGSWRMVRLDRDVKPVFVPSDPTFGGVSQEFPNLRRGFSGDLGGPTWIGGKLNLISQSRGDAMGLAMRAMVRFPSGSPWAHTNDWDYSLDLIASREAAKKIELTGLIGGVVRGDPDEFDVSDGVKWGMGAQFPSRSKLRALVEYQGEFVIDANTEVLHPPFVAEDGSVAPILSPISDPTNITLGTAFNAGSFFAHAGFNYSFGASSRMVNGLEIDHNPWGFEVSLGWHPGVTPARERVRTIKETTTVTNTVTPPPPPPANRNPTFGGGAGGAGNGLANCDPGVVAPGAVSRCTATATDPDGDAVTYRWTAPSGTFSAPDAQNTNWTAPTQPGNVPITVTATDARGGSATATVTVQVVRREELTFEDVHFDFDRYTLRPEAIKILDDAISKLNANADTRVTIEGHTDSVGTTEYNLALGERRANAVRDYLASRGITNVRLRTVSYGEERPIADNTTAAGRAQNRRAHLAVILEQ